METAQLDLETLGKWTKAKRIQTRNGPRIFRTSRPTEEFTLAYRAHKEFLKSQGMGWKKLDDGTWEIQWWAQLPADEVEARAKAEDLSRQADADFVPPSPEGLEYLPYQKAGVLYGLRCFGVDVGQMKKGGCPSRRGVLIADEMGL